MCITVIIGFIMLSFAHNITEVMMTSILSISVRAITIIKISIMVTVVAAGTIMAVRVAVNDGRGNFFATAKEKF